MTQMRPERRRGISLLAILPEVSHFLTTEILLPIGGNVLVVLSLFFYIVITWSILRFFQVLYKFDERMRIISGAYFEERTNPTV